MPKSKPFTVEFAEMAKAIGEHLREIRIRKNKLIYTVTKDLNLSYRTVLKIEEGMGDYYMFSLFLLCDYYGIKVSDLYRVGEYKIKETQIKYETEKSKQETGKEKK